MFQTQMINMVLLWERRLEIEKEQSPNQRKSNGYEPAADYPAEVQWNPSDRRPASVQNRIPVKEGQPAFICYAQEHCCEV